MLQETGGHGCLGLRERDLLESTLRGDRLPRDADSRWSGPSDWELSATEQAGLRRRAAPPAGEAGAAADKVSREYRHRA